MRIFTIFLFTFLYFIHPATSQVVPQRVLDTIINHELAQGMKLERINRPDFSRPEAPNYSFLGECYPGKILMVIIVMAKKPSNLVFEVKSIAKLEEIKPLQEFILDGKTYWLDFRVLRFKKDLSDFSNHCLFVRSDDRAEERLPIYQIFLTEPY